MPGGGGAEPETDDGSDDPVLETEVLVDPSEECDAVNDDCPGEVGGSETNNTTSTEGEVVVEEPVEVVDNEEEMVSGAVRMMGGSVGGSVAALVVLFWAVVRAEM